MISFKQYLVELFDKPYPYREHKGNFGSLNDDVYSFTASDGADYKASISIVGEHLVVSFGKVKSDGGYDLKPIEGLGRDASRIYATIGYILRKVVKLNPSITTINFSSASSRTRPLYARFAKMIAKELGGEVVYNRLSRPDVFIIKLR